MKEILATAFAISALFVALQFLRTFFTLVQPTLLSTQIRQLLICDVIFTLFFGAIEIWDKLQPPTHPELSRDLLQVRNYYENLLADRPVVIGLMFVLLCLVIVSWVLIYRRSRYGRRVFLLRLLASCLLIIGCGPQIQDRWESVISYVGILIEGTLFGLLCVTTPSPTVGE
jgi:cytochrome c biogenesis factor